jgi:large subunit ribosomal protein L35
MPKLRSHKSAAKRLRFTATGKAMGRHGFKSHLLTRKSSTRKRRLRRPLEVSAGDARRVNRMLPYGRK